MRRNLDALDTGLHDAVVDWNDFTENEKGGTILSREQISELVSELNETALAFLESKGLI